MSTIGECRFKEKHLQMPLELCGLPQSYRSVWMLLKLCITTWHCVMEPGHIHIANAWNQLQLRKNQWLVGTLMHSSSEPCELLQWQHRGSFSCYFY